jgi:hypothetical protein
LWFHGSATTIVGSDIDKDQMRNLAKVPIQKKKSLLASKRNICSSCLTAHSWFIIVIFVAFHAAGRRTQNSAPCVTGVSP